MTQFSSKVADIRLESRVGLDAVWWMSLDPSDFQPGGTGLLEAVTRSGTKLSIPVSSVVMDEEGVIWCVVDKPLAAGTEVVGTVLSSPQGSPTA